MSSKIFCKSWGAEYIAADVVRFRLWATGQQKVMLRLAGKDQEMQANGDGWFTLDVSGVTPGTEYNFVLSDGMVVPDPASRAQKTDVNGPSYVVDPGSYAWRNTGWKGSRWEQAVVYEMHTGTFTPEGTFRAAIAKLPYLAELGVTVIEVMPVAQFGGERGWGYDGVLLYAPHSAYGTPDDFKAFIDAAHGYGLSVVLDIVLNHFGPEGNYLPLLAPAFFHKERMTPWGNGIAYDVDAVRRYIIEAPLYWLTEYHLDGLRFDAIDQIEDSSARHVLVEIAQRIREDITDRPIHLTTEDSRNIISLHPRDQDGNAPLFTAEWNDDFAARLLGSGDLYDLRGRRPWSSVNFITAHDGFTLNDLVSYNDKYNEANGEDNNDGHNDNRSCNYGAEGPTDDEGINAIREQQKRNFLTTLLFSHGTPMLLAGDEFGRSQMGNNNGYCQDSEISWVHWDNLPETANALREFTRHLIQLRATQPLLRRESWRDGLEIRWFNAGGGAQQSEQWDEGSTIGVCISRPDLQPEAGIWHDALLLFNPFEGSVPFRIPMWGEGGWVLELTTADNAQQGMRITEEMDFDLAGRSIVLFRRP
ncbi:TPA: malto-oligosyltrehalose trehalohydrolase [Salmonella enterica subsp. enterica serovar Paratyphi B]|nr:malto-oligosyltrehalose trehalohydrolase [Salmonella enterica subsp. enterica serovar Paratyphi B]HCM9008275.1 malto-oligosyltrehalose trehalohydrolase [Salmonella enterica subsp. enterica serovar Paratyphi B]HCM9039370.1 malto-oligosyltrehalose trehalohydrolase [Salmonella enterica subsp. enterica serovar Paratyphi B]HCM9060632.1 malto-oligosyltrehalose trehalohydrolase [Salmonella enterica subsp. enterica serovar Paratyphi B]HCM9073891.1 malto-oligosyltrehalose trehalohydrolase [Salmonella